MSFEAISSNVATYQDSVKSAQKVEIENQAQQEIETQTAAEEIKVPETGSILQEKNNKEEKGKQKEKQPTDQQIKAAIEIANSKMKYTKTGREFSYDEKTKRISIKVFDKDTKEVIREIPPEETRKMLEKLCELAGILVDEKR